MSKRLKYVGLSLVSLLVMGGVALAGYNFTRAELEAKSKAELVDLVLAMQTILNSSNGGGSTAPGNCQTYQPLKGESGQLLTRVNHSGYSDDGTLKWPNGQTFLLRHSGYSDDLSTYYPNNSIMVRTHSGYSDHGTILWPNTNTLFLTHSGYSDDGSIFRNNGSTWLRRHSGYSDDGQVTGPPVETFSGVGFTVKARLTASQGVTVSTTITDPNYDVTVTVDSTTHEIFVKECF